MNDTNGISEDCVSRLWRMANFMTISLLPKNDGQTVCLSRSRCSLGSSAWHPIPVGILIGMAALDGQSEGGARKMPTRMIGHGPLRPAFLQITVMATVKAAKSVVTKGGVRLNPDAGAKPQLGSLA